MRVAVVCFVVGEDLVVDDQVLAGAVDGESADGASHTQLFLEYTALLVLRPSTSEEDRR
jgi:hypothetical protein